MKSRIEFLTEGIVRTALFNASRYLRIPTNETDVSSFCAELYKDSFFKEALFLASPSLYEQWKAHIERKINLSSEKSVALEKSIIKYYVRICTRCTPFGLFSSYDYFNLRNKKTDTSPWTENQSYQRLISIDLHFLYNLVNELNKRENIKELVRYNKNNSMYQVGQSFRYVEVEYINKTRTHKTSSIQSDQIIELLFSNLKSGSLKKEELIRLLMDSIEDVSRKDVHDYLEALIAAQVLVGDFSISLNQSNPLEQILSFLDKNSAAVLLDEFTEKAYKALKKLNEKIILLRDDNDLDYIEEYKNMISLVDKLEIDYEKQYFINLNLKGKPTSNSNTIDLQDLKLVRESIQRLAFFYDDTIDSNSRLNEFKSEFYKKFEDQEVPLLVALDNEIGIDYRGIDQHAKTFSPLIDDLPWNSGNGFTEDLKINSSLHDFWNSILLKASSENVECIDISELKPPLSESRLHKISKTFSVMFSKAGENIVVKSIGGKALNMIGRFTNLDGELKGLVNKITDIEKTENEDALLAELIHLPNDRTANIIAREINRDIEIPYLSQKSKESKSLVLEDICISLKYNKFVLRSNKFNREIKVFNSNAHNFRYNSLPVYEFLCDLQYDTTIRNFGVFIGSINSRALKYFPRIVYKKRVIVSPATWKFSINDFRSQKNETPSIVTQEQFLGLAKSYKVPRYVYLSEGDNNLLIDLHNAYLTEYIIDVLNKGKEVLLIENFELLEKPTGHATEYLIPFTRELSNKQERVFTQSKSNVKRVFPPGDEWVYYKIYTGIKTADKLLSQAIPILIEKIQDRNLLQNWFFIRYNDPLFHIRLRIKINPEIPDAFSKISVLVNEILSSYQKGYLISDIELSSYKRELERYGWENIEFAESIFHYDSEMALMLIRMFKIQHEDYKRNVYCLKAIHGCFDVFGLGLKERLNIMKNLSDSFSKEFEANSAMKKQLGIKFRSLKDDIKDCLGSSTSNYDEIVNRRNNRILDLFKSLPVTDKKKVINCLPSYIHMTVNRMMTASPRMHELVLYSLLEKHYRILLYSKKKENMLQGSE